MPPLAYFPDGRVASKAAAIIPVTQPEPMHGPDNIQLFQSMPNPIRQSDEQGIGRSPGQRWPHMPHVEQYNFDALSNQGWHPGDVVQLDRQGWSAPVYYQQSAVGHHVFPVAISIESPVSIPYTQVAAVR